ncbi:MAG TPA: serine/threonine-protein kinase [Pseudomonadota bacterium]|nr:serine/threonine-protein kinase [Pseudomonadota bacterium]
MDKKSKPPPRSFRELDPSLLADTVQVPSGAPPPLGQTPPAAPPAADRAAPSEDISESGAIMHGGLSSRIGRYVLLRTLGKGGMGVVYAAYDEDLDRKVAVKLLHSAHQADTELRLRIIREAQALARVSSPNVVHVYEVGEIENEMFIAMEFVNGTTLTKWQAAQKRTWQELMHMYLAAGRGLLAAHQAGLTHRDFKPDNVLVGSDGTPKVADFGLARLHGDETAGGTPGAAAEAVEAPSSQLAMTPNRFALTQEGTVVGTPLYMSPEQHLGEAADRRSDQFSFCVALYEALYGELPFAGKNLPTLRHNVVRGKLQPRPAGSRVPLPVHQALLRGLEVLPEKRFPSMQELLAALAFDEARDPAAAPRARRGVTAGLVAFAVLSPVVTRLILWRGANPFLVSLGMAVVFFLIFGLLAFHFRHRLLRNAFHRTMIVSGLVFAGQILGIRVVGILLGLSLPQIFTFDLVSMSSMIGLLSATVLPRFWLCFPIAVGCTLLSAARPSYAHVITPIMTPLVILSAVILWNSAARSQKAGEGRRALDGRRRASASLPSDSDEAAARSARTPAGRAGTSAAR